jgi:aspartate aminotransferase
MSSSAPRRVSRRIAAITPSATLAVDTQAKALKAAGENVIGFGAGEPDFPTPDHIVEAAAAACRDPKNHRYSAAAGLPELRKAIAEKTLRDSGYEVTPDQVIVTNGGKHAVYNAFAAIIDPGDEVLLPAPYWTTYPEPIRLAGGVPVEIFAPETAGFRVMVFVSPSNPTGAVYPREEVEAIGRWAAENDVWVITDEIYEHLTYDGHEFHSIAALVPEVADRCLVLNGVAKTYAMTGWRVGWMVGPADVVKAASGLQSHQTSNVANVCQQAALAALTGGLDDVVRMRESFDRRGKLMHRLLNAIDGVSCMVPQGAFYAFPSMEDILQRGTVAGRPVSTTVDLAAVILEEAKVAIVPGEAFAAPGYARLSFALGDDDLGEGIERIAELLSR